METIIEETNNKKETPTYVPLEEVFSSKGRIKILQLLCKHREMSVTQITTRTRLNHNTVLTHLQSLVKYGIVIEKKYGRIRIFALNPHSKLTLILINFIKSWKNENYFILQK